MANQITDEKMIEKLDRMAAEQASRPVVVFSDDQLRGFITDAVQAEAHNLSVGYVVEIIDNVFDIDEFSEHYRSENCNVRDYDPEDLKILVEGMTVCKGLKGGRSNRICFCLKAIKEVQSEYQFTEAGIRRHLRVIVRHEFRHAAQFTYLIRKGGIALADHVVDLDASGAYGVGILEADAIRFQDSDQGDVYEGLDEIFVDVA